ncbi:hypothetical protein [Amycolatopsis sp. NPDC001319]|uniref:hypothetical protein n=1 Tax=unclassified Amycolatopsis TaxID=2618356 RepID=UPI0036AFC4FF
MTGAGGSGGWYGLVDILRERQDIARAEHDERPVACPHDGEPLTESPDGLLFCTFDGWNERMRRC